MLIYNWLANCFVKSKFSPIKYLYQNCFENSKISDNLGISFESSHFCGLSSQKDSKKVFVYILSFRSLVLTLRRSRDSFFEVEKVIYFLDECSYLSSICFDAPVPSVWRLPIYPRVLLLVTRRYMFIIFSDRLTPSPWILKILIPLTCLKSKWLS